MPKGINDGALAHSLFLKKNGSWWKNEPLGENHDILTLYEGKLLGSAGESWSSHAICRKIMMFLHYLHENYEVPTLSAEKSWCSYTICMRIIRFPHKLQEG